MTYSASFAFAPDEKVQLKEAPRVSGKVIALHIDRNKARWQIGKRGRVTSKR